MVWKFIQADPKLVMPPEEIVQKINVELRKKLSVIFWLIQVDIKCEET